MPTLPTAEDSYLLKWFLVHLLEWAMSLCTIEEQPAQLKTRAAA
jgi:hypothetical protein